MATTSRRLIVLCYAFICVNLLLTGAGETQTFFTDVTEKMEVPLFPARTAAVGDYDNDGWPDVFLTENSFPGGTGLRIALLNNEGNGRFPDCTTVIQTEFPSVIKGGGAIFGDYDNDGDLDLFVSMGAGFSENRHVNVLLRNDRGVFREVTRKAGLVDEGASDEALWWDYNRDGHLDLYVSNVGDPETRNRLYRNNREGGFSDVTEEAGLNIALDQNRGGSNAGMAAGDFNSDGWPDLFIVVSGFPNRLFLNDGKGTFVDASTHELSPPSRFNNGFAVGDIDNDGDLDIFIPILGLGLEERSVMLLNRGEGQFIDVTEGIGLAEVSALSLIDANMADIDNDGDIDLVTSRPHLFYVNNGTGTFENRTVQSGIPDRNSTVSFGDFNLDGFLDVMFGADFESERFGGLFRYGTGSVIWDTQSLENDGLRSSNLEQFGNRESSIDHP